MFIWLVSALFLFICTFSLRLCIKALVCLAGGGVAAHFSEPFLEGCLGQCSSPSSDHLSLALSHPVLHFRLSHASLCIHSSLRPSGQTLQCKVELKVVQEESGNLRLTSGENSQEELCYFSVLHNQMCLQLLCVNNGSTDAHWWFQRVPHGVQADHPL